MIDEKQLFRSIRKHEGLRLRSYQDSLGHWTVGYGHLLQDVPEKYRPHILIPEALAEEWLVEDVRKAVAQAQEIPEWRLLDKKARRNVFIEMVFQLGGTGVSKFKRMLGHMHKPNPSLAIRWDQVSAEMLDSKWAKEDTPERAAELATVMRTGWYG